MPSKKINPQIERTWKAKLEDEFNSPYFVDLKNFLLSEKRLHQVYPPSSQIFNAFNTTPFHKVKAVILGQDPYHGPHQAHGLSFSVLEGVKIPPSLKNIFKELNSDVGFNVPKAGDLTRWAERGVLLLNATLTVRRSEAGSHQNKGWERFTDASIQALSDERKHVVFMLWGNYARSKKTLINTEKHLVLEAPHPSPFSAHTGFFGCKHFSRTNDYLIKCGQEPIDWNLD